jgi:F0F1-type ATP synthase membrane subunit b/b'
LAVALGFLGLAVLTGLLLPRTRQEDKLMGETSDELIEQAKEAGKETLEKTKTVAQRVAASTIEEAKRQGITPETARDKVSEIADKVGAVATQVKEQAARAAEEEGLKPGAVAESSKQRGGETGR